MEAATPSDTELLHRYQAGDVSARDLIAERHMPMARWVARRYFDTSTAQEDLEQVAYVGLLKSIDRFDPGLGAFRTYAITTIRGELRRHFRDHGWAMKVPRPLQENYVAVTEALRGLDVQLGRAPTPKDLADKTGLTLEQVAEALDVGQAYAPPSLDAPLAGDDPESRSLADAVGSEDGGFASVEHLDQVGDAFGKLPRVQQQVVRMRFVEDLTQSQIAERLEVSQMSVSRWLRQALTQLSEAAFPA